LTVDGGWQEAGGSRQVAVGGHRSAVVQQKRQGIATVANKETTKRRNDVREKTKTPARALRHLDIAAKVRLKPTREKTKTPARALRLAPRPLTSRDKRIGERKQKRPQGHCDALAPGTLVPPLRPREKTKTPARALRQHTPMP